MGKYVVVMHGPASIYFKPNEQFQINNTNGIVFTFRSRYQDKSYDVNVPTDIWIEIVGDAKNISEAAENFANLANLYTNMISFACNASIGPLEITLVFDRTEGLIEHDFMQCHIPERFDLLIPGRPIDIDLVKNIVEAISVHKEKERLLNAIMQYCIALSYWRPSERIRILSHLFMGMEVMKVVYRRKIIEEEGISEVELAERWNIKIEKPNRIKVWVIRKLGGTIKDYNNIKGILDSEVRRKILFKEDIDCHRKAKKASDGFEHGFMSTLDIRVLAHSVDKQTAQYLRGSIIDILDINETMKDKLLSKSYYEPRGPLKIIKYVYAKIFGEATELAMKDKEYPYVEWSTKIENVKINELGNFVITPKDNMTARIGEDIKMIFSHIEAWDGSTISKQDN